MSLLELTNGADATITDVASSTNYGSDTALQVGVLVVGKSTTIYRCAFLFDLSALIGATISDAQLDLTVDGTGNHGAEAYRVHRCSRTDLTELGVTWDKYDGSSNWTSGGGDYEASEYAEYTPSGVSDDHEYDVTTLAVDAIENRSGLLALIWKKNAEVTSVRVSAYSKDAGSDEPKLSITYTPAAGDPLEEHQFNATLHQASGLIVPVTQGRLLTPALHQSLAASPGVYQADAMTATLHQAKSLNVPR